MKKLVVFMATIFLIVACSPLPEGSNEQASPSPPDVTTVPSDQPPSQSNETKQAISDSKSKETPPPAALTATKTADQSPEIAADPAAAVPPPEPTIDKWSLWVNGPHLRGANIWQAVVVPELDGLEFKGPGPVGPPFTQEDFHRLAALGANYVSISGPGLFTETPPYTVDQGVEANLDNLLAIIAEADMFATIGFRTGPGRSEFSLCCGGDPYFEGYFNDSVWEDQAAQDAWVEMWRYTAERYGDNPIVAGYKLMVEPNAAGVLLDMYDPEEFYAEYAGTLYDWNQFYPRLVAGIREVDANTPILVGGMSWSGVAWLPYLQPTDDPRSVYVVHQYAPQDQYTHQEPDGENTYPGVFDTDWDGEDDQFDRAWLDHLLSTIDTFVATHGVPVAVDEYGLIRWVPNAAEFMDDEMELFEQRGLNYALWEWQTSWEPFAEEVHAFDFRLGSDPENRTEVDSSDLMDVIIRYWARNTVRPSNAIQAASPATPIKSSAAPPSLSDVSNWLYLIDVNLEQDTVERIAASEYDMVVLDFITSEVNNTDYPLAEVVAQLHQAPQPKLVIAYIDISQAEEYRTYWQPDWGIGRPEWIVGADPDGWAGNYPVAYWEDEWREIWLGEDGYLQAILEAGFDGVYLDWVEAYSDENVIAIARQHGVDPRQEMIWWVGDIAEFTRAQRPNFIIIGQNAAELAASDEYVAIIDAIAQEQVWFDGAADNDPPGDCPLPRTEAEVETEAYVAGLSAPCRAMYEELPDSTLHVSSEEYLRDLTLAQSKGLVIFTVDYALEPENISWVHKTSRGLGFVPFVGNRALDRYVAPVLETDAPASGDWWQPTVDTTWQWQLEQSVDQSLDVDMYDIEMFDNDAGVVADLHAQGRRVVCYISVGSWEDWRPDQERFPASVIGNDYGGWPGEKWLDIRQIDLLAPIMRARLDECQAKGFDGIEPDNIDGYTNDTGFPLTYEDQLNYNIWLANEAHTRGLSIGLKNNPDQVDDLLPYFDWALTEDCFAEGWCEQMLPFIEAGKPVFAAEYTDTGITTDKFCPQANEMNFSAILKNRDLNAWQESCR